MLAGAGEVLGMARIMVAAVVMVAEETAVRNQAHPMDSLAQLIPAVVEVVVVSGEVFLLEQAVLEVPEF
jgi:hypothetical protein